MHMKMFTVSLLSVDLLYSLIGNTNTCRCKIGMNDDVDMKDTTTVHLRTSPERSSYWKTDFVSVAETSKHEVKDNLNLGFYSHTF